ncbi:MAG: prepilin-type N-terminal cleavage/methylation domain-containing protein [Verrucomicrobia bacterium]|nr:prepilin-type N-terminal cleavage/methylation domain-containing protein [Verrucomicrobiota bacterium]MCG2680255.1 prepilin-type N-terminal cleavage/methylation domain-containing protein [Kiritimatiellia bacterium]MBU4248543.1 prepilin-type N-terminal cleavage/methylation domain-containing protein [Verrucomicrobiota bacterium]MBU4289780.1 prepilin-type N-terminal cleavage/methylation domain-containing protein [Verrucomicrobiota bacterium]MBU4429588.1 prepilin-type N-terminal cleavage/methylat
MKRYFPYGARHGLTLIELLVAIAIAVLLVGVVYLVYGNALNTIRAQTAWRESLEPAEDALDTLQRDIMCSLALRGTTNPPFVLTPASKDESKNSTLCFFTAWPGEGSNDWRAYGIREVEYALRVESATGQYALIRQCRPFRISAAADGLPAAPSVGAPFTAPPAETLLRSVAGMQILVYDGTEWTNAWGTDATAGRLPQAARISLQLEHSPVPRTVSSEVLIPAGHRIKAPAQIEKAANPSPSTRPSP